MNVNRHTGGLENVGTSKKKDVNVNRHTGGLENNRQGQGY